MGKIVVLACLLQLACSVGAQVTVGSMPPRTIADIAALLDQHQPEADKVQAARRQLERPPPVGQRGRDVMVYHQDQAKAAEELGFASRALDHRRKALESMRGEFDESSLLRDLANAEQTYGNLSGSLRIREELLRNRHLRSGNELGAHFAIARTLGALGDMPGVWASFESGSQIFDRYVTASWAAPFRNNWHAARGAARSTLLVLEGKLEEAEAGLRSTIVFAAEDRKGAESRFGSVVNALPPETLDRNRERLEFLLVDVLLAGGKLNEAELVSRNALKQVLVLVGRQSPHTAQAVMVLASVLIAQGRFREATRLAEASAGILDQVNGSRGSLLSGRPHELMMLGALGREDWTAAARHLDELQRVLGTVDEVTRRAYRETPEMALVLLMANRSSEALVMAKAVLDRTASLLGAGHPLAAEARGIHAAALAANGRGPLAIGEFREAANQLLTAGTRPAEADGSTLKVLKRRVILEAYIALLANPSMAEPLRSAGIDPVSEGFRVADAARVGGVQRALAASAARAASSQAGLGDLIRKEQDGRQEVQVLYDNLLRLMNLPVAQQPLTVITAMRARIQAIERERTQLYSDIERQFPDYSAVVNPRPASLEEARRVLRPSESLVSILPTRERSYVWHLNAAGETLFHVADIGESAIRDIVVRLRESLDPGEVSLDRLQRFDVAGANRLYSMLLGPGERVWSKSSALVVVASGALAQIPFAVLPTSGALPARSAGAPLLSEFQSVPWLAARVAIASVPAVASFVRLRALPGGGAERAAFAGFGDPSFSSKPVPPETLAATRSLRLRNLQIARIDQVAPDPVKQAPSWTAYSDLTPLPDTRDEILSIAGALGANLGTDVFLGADASKRRVKSEDLRNRRIVAFATHGLVAGDLPGLEQPALALASTGDSAESPLLTLDDVLSLKLNADWVILSACNTAAGDGRGAEAVSGLGRGFFYAGTRSLLVTHWPVETVSARKLVVGIFERYAKQPGITRAEALQGAMMELMKTGTQEFSYAHPLFWAPYALVGDGGR